MCELSSLLLFVSENKGISMYLFAAPLAIGKAANG
jgi:hypothetical protein